MTSALRGAIVMLSFKKPACRSGVKIPSGRHSRSAVDNSEDIPDQESREYSQEDQEFDKVCLQA